MPYELIHPESADYRQCRKRGHEPKHHRQAGDKLGRTYMGLFHSAVHGNSKSRGYVHGHVGYPNSPPSLAFVQG